MSLIENCALYLPSEKLDKGALPVGSKTNGGLLKKPSQVTIPSQDGAITLTLQTGAQIGEHLQGFLGYAAQANATPSARKEAEDRIKATQMVCGVNLPGPVPFDSHAIASLTAFANAAGGFLFVQDSILVASGFLVGPMAKGALMDPVATVQLDPEEIASRQDNASPEAKARRTRTHAKLSEKGFRCAPSLPIDRGLNRLRPAEDIASRMGAASIVYLFLVAPEDFISEAELRASASVTAIARAFTPRELDIFAMPRAEAKAEHGNTAGWALENIWGLAWAIGFEFTPEIDTGFIPEEPAVTLRYWMPIGDQTMEQVLSRVRPRTFEQVADLEDLFYCAHNAVRSAQLGHSDTVPEGFDPMADGGTVHERRHALTWCLSPGVDWDNTDLST